MHNLFDEYRYFPKYPDKPLRTTALLFGALVQHGLVANITLGMFLRYVLEALKKPADSKMAKFGAIALEQFASRLFEWPQYCQHIAAIPHIREIGRGGVTVAGAPVPEVWPHLEAALSGRAPTGAMSAEFLATDVAGSGAPAPAPAPAPSPAPAPAPSPHRRPRRARAGAGGGGAARRAAGRSEGHDGRRRPRPLSAVAGVSADVGAAPPQSALDAIAGMIGGGAQLPPGMGPDAAAAAAAAAAAVQAPPTATPVPVTQTDIRRRNSTRWRRRSSAAAPAASARSRRSTR